MLHRSQLKPLYPDAPLRILPSPCFEHFGAGGISFSPSPVLCAVGWEHLLLFPTTCEFCEWMVGLGENQQRKVFIWKQSPLPHTLPKPGMSLPVKGKFTETDLIHQK